MLVTFVLLELLCCSVVDWIVFQRETILEHPSLSVNVLFGLAGLALPAGMDSSRPSQP